MTDYHQRFMERFDFIDCSALNGTEILAFIDEVVTEERTALIEKIEGMELVSVKKVAGYDSSRMSQDVFRSAYNAALDDLLTYLRANP